MSAPRVCLLRAPGTNCDEETAYAFETAGGQPATWHLNRILEDASALDDAQILCLPGGFSFGDDVGAGVLFADRLKTVRDRIVGLLDRGGLVLGICNGFQVLMNLGLLGDHGESGEPSATLTWNTSGRYDARWVPLRTVNTENVFLRGLETFEWPIAHAEGRLAVADGVDLADWHARGLIALAYSEPASSDSASSDSASSDVPYDPAGAILEPPANPNGSSGNIAGLSNEAGTILGLMPHPERAIRRTHHPAWTRQPASCEPMPGLRLFQNAVAHFA